MGCHHSRLVLWVAVLASLAASCAFEPLDLGEVDEYGTFFDLVWRTFDRHYVGFEWIGLDWAQQYDTYSAGIDTVSSMTGLVLLLQQMLIPLQDHDILLSFGGDSFPTCSLGPIEPNYDWDVLWTGYMEPAGFQWFIYDVWGWCALDSTVPYVLIKEWSAAIYARDLENVIEAYPDAPGMIVDVRPTSGGSPMRIREVMKRLNDELRLGFYLAERNGPGHDDLYLDPYNIYTVPGHFQGPIAMLIGETCEGACERFALMGEMVPQITLIGDTTRGDISELIYRMLPGGSYSVPWLTVVLADTSGTLQGRGVFPDIFVEYREGGASPPTDDPVLEYALDWVNGR